MNHEHEKGTARIEAFSDGIFAVAITLLVLNIAPPPVEKSAQIGLVNALLGLWPVYLSFITSFFTILVMWVNHHRLFTVIRRSDEILMLLNGLLLLGVVIVPFSTSLVATYLQQPDQHIAAAVYNGWFLLISVFFQSLWQYAAAGNRLFDQRSDPKIAMTIARQYAYGPLLYVIAIVVSFVNVPLAIFVNLALAVFFALPNKTLQQLLAVEMDEEAHDEVK